jgi:hypothetical protein
VLLFSPSTLVKTLGTALFGIQGYKPSIRGGIDPGLYGLFSSPTPSSDDILDVRESFIGVKLNGSSACWIFGSELCFQDSVFLPQSHNLAVIEADLLACLLTDGLNVLSDEI